MRAASVTAITPITSAPIDLNNLCGCFFGMHIAYQHARAQSLGVETGGDLEALCHWFSHSLASGPGGIACCGTAKDSASLTPCVMASGWRAVDADTQR